MIALGLTGATVRLCPGVDPDLAAPALPDHLTPRQTSEAHPITLKIEGANEIIVRSAGTDLSPVQQIGNASMMLEIVIPTGFEGKVTDWSADDVRAEMGLRMAEQIAALLDGDRPVDRQRVRDLALKGNLLTSETSLVFEGAEGEATGVLPAMRKLALVDAVSSDVQAVPSQVPAVEPAGSPPAPDGDFPAPGRARGFAVRWPTVGARPPWHVRLGNWWRNRRPRREVSTDMSHLGAQLRSAASQVLWNQDGVLALRSGDAAHLPREVAAIVRDVAAVEDVRRTSMVMNLAPDHLAIALLAQAAASAGVASPDLLDQLFPDRLPLPFERLVRQLGVSA